MDTNNMLHLCRICIASSGNCTQMISIFGEDSLWKKITTLADVKIEKGDTLPQQVCVHCAKNAISACLFKKKCEDADNFFRQQLLIQKIEGQQTINTDENKTNATATDVGETRKTTAGTGEESADIYDEAESILPHNSGEDDPDNSNESNNSAANRCNGFENHHHNAMGSHHENDIIAEDGEIKNANGVDKPPFDFHSIRLMHEYMQQQLSKFNGAPSHRGAPGSHSAGSGSDGNADDEEPLPLIPEIELITPSEDLVSGSNGNGTVVGTSATGAPLRGYQCPNCFQIFEMKQILKAHMQSVHGTVGPVYECSNCKKTYFYKRFLEKHVRRGRCVKKRRNQTRPMQCSDCHVLFPTGHHLGWHKRTGCPSRAAKMPLQQLFKQNIVQYNNFPKRIGLRKPENAIYLHNRKLIMANKRKGRTRIKLDAKKIALAKQLILREATTTVIANELNISRTFAWRLRKSLVNGVSLHERVIDPNAEEQQPDSSIEQQLLANEQQEKFIKQNHQQRLQHNQESIMNIKSEEDDDDDCCEDGEEEDEIDDDEAQLNDDNMMEVDGEDDMEDQHPAAKLLMNQMDEHQMTLNDQYSQLQHTAAEVEVGGEDDEKHEGVGIHDNGETETDGEDANDQVQLVNSALHHQQQLQQQHQKQQLQKHQQRDQQQIFLQNMALHGVPSEKVAEAAAAALKDLKFQKNFINGGNGVPLVIPPLHPFPTAIAPALNQLPVNLSIRPIASLQKKELISPATNTTTSNNSHQTKKPRKPNVFIDDEKYAMAQTLVAQNSSTMEIARALNVSQMTAWKVRDAIIKGVPLSYRNKRGEVGGLNRVPANNKPEENSNENHESNASVDMDVAQIAKDHIRLQQQQQIQQQLQQQQEHQQKLLEQQIRGKQQHQQKQLELIQRQQIQQQQHMQQHKQQQLILQEQQRRLEQKEEQTFANQQLNRVHQLPQQPALQMHSPLQQQQQSSKKNTINIKLNNEVSSNHGSGNNTSSRNTNNNNANRTTKLIHPRRRLKAAEREQRDKEITREILELIKEDSNIQYWKVSARLAEKGYPISPSSVCQKLKSMGIHRRWKPGDKPPLMLAPSDMEQLKTNLLSASAATNVANCSSNDESYEQQFELGGAHFLSAFTR